MAVKPIHSEIGFAPMAGENAPGVSRPIYQGETFPVTFRPLFVDDHWWYCITAIDSTGTELIGYVKDTQVIPIYRWQVTPTR